MRLIVIHFRPDLILNSILPEFTSSSFTQGNGLRICNGLTLRFWDKVWVQSILLMKLCQTLYPTYISVYAFSCGAAGVLLNQLRYYGLRIYFPCSLLPWSHTRRCICTLSNYKHRHACSCSLSQELAYQHPQCLILCISQQD